MVQYNLQVGLQWIAAGAHVFVTGPDKKPRVKWRNESTTDPNKLKEWFANWPDSLVAIDLAKSDLVGRHLKTSLRGTGDASKKPSAYRWTMRACSRVGEMHAALQADRTGSWTTVAMAVQCARGSRFAGDLC